MLQEIGGWEIEMLPYTLYFQIKIDNFKRNLVCLDLVIKFYFDYFYFVVFYSILQLLYLSRSFLF